MGTAPTVAASPREIRTEPLTAAAFAPFGQVISAGRGVGAMANMGTATRFDYSASFENLRPAAKANLAVFRAAELALPLPLKLLERHPRSTQMFLPLLGDRMLVVVAPDAADGGPDVSKLRAFVGVAGQGVNYRTALWHHPIVALGREADLAMLAWEDGTALDCEQRPLAEPLVVIA
jgi:ureidoglycolate lyase